MHIDIAGAADYAAQFDHFKREYGVQKVIGFSGGADDHLKGLGNDDDLQRQYSDLQHKLQSQLISSALNALQGYRIGVLTGGTRSGVPSIATKLAKENGFPTIAVIPAAGAKYALGNEYIDLQITVEPLLGNGFWGDEGPAWTTIVDGIFVIGGAAGTLTECAHIMKINESLVKNGQTPKYVIPMHGTGGVADQLHQLWAKPHIRDVSMPRHRVLSGYDAAQLMIDALDLYSEFEHKSYDHGGASYAV